MTDSWMIKYLAEGIGTMFLVLLGNGTIAAVTLKGSKNKGMGGLSIAWGYGIALMLPVLVFANVSGAHVNPALTLGLASAGLFPWAHVAQYILAQLLGAIVGQLLVVAIYNQYYLKTNDGDLALGTFATTNALEDLGRTKAMINGFVNEMIGTFVLVFGIMGFTTNFFGAESIKWYMNYAKEQGADITSSSTVSQIWTSVSGASASKMVGALAIGLLLVGLITCFGGPTGAALNPARDLGPRLVYKFMPTSVLGEKTDSKWWYAWVPVVAPLLGGVIAATVFKLMFN
ncbi:MULTISPECIES: MIP/aquaporin family protein [unclassified Lactococcus]|uniref:MIP/aquaporin family protein n=1 Tax=unclassified Lactococcus TaxID=2643510 RepID=UPI0011CB9F5B|nr:MULTISPECIES: MIP/aquaporin family protein [unclassified Lactococcus]MQW23041.1 aquaporin [Lactococcus sp. dk101]TXK44386.1 aquaporin family protein [Lactococcus sp. dk310]TXK50196.1 aquaporin family protein [Lactococcus sp. dk322]